MNGVEFGIARRWVPPGLTRTIGRSALAVFLAPLLMFAAAGSAEAAHPATVRLDEFNSAVAGAAPQGWIIAQSAQTTAPAQTAPELERDLPQHVVLYEEDPSSPSGRRYVGSVLWRTDQIKVAGQPDEVAIRADIEVPARKLNMTLSLKRNVDKSRPSHTIEVTFHLPADFAGGDVSSVPGILMKADENARGKPLAGLAVKVTAGSFLVGLSNATEDRAGNLQLLLECSWIDVPLVYGDKRRAIVAIEKGVSGDRAFKSAFAAWGQTPPAASPMPRQPGETHVDLGGRSGGFVVQVSSQRSEEDAEASYRALQGKFPTVLADRAPIIKRADLGDKGVYYRASVGPFDTAEEASQFCSSLRTAGGQCVVQRN